MILTETERRVKQQSVDSVKSGFVELKREKIHGIRFERGAMRAFRPPVLVDAGFRALSTVRARPHSRAPNWAMHHEAKSATHKNAR